MKLYYASPSPFARKVRVLARELGMETSIDEIAVHTTPITPAAELQPASPLSKIPVLVTDDGASIHDSAVICEYLLARAGRDPDNSPDRWKVLTRQALVDGILDAALAHRYEIVLRPTELHWRPWLDAQLAKVRSGLAALSSDIPPAGSQPGVDAIAAACLLGWLDFRMPELGWRAAHPALEAFHEQFASRPSMLDTHPSK